MSCVFTKPSVVKKFVSYIYQTLDRGRMVEWSYDRMVVRSYGPIERTYLMALNPLRLKVTYGNQQDIPYFNSYEKLNSNIL